MTAPSPLRCGSMICVGWTKRAAFKASAALDVTTRGIRNDPSLDQTAAIQALLHADGILRFAAAVYRAGTRHIRSDPTIFLAPGTVRGMPVRA